MVELLGSAIVFGSITAGIGSLALVWYLRRHRDSAGARWFMATLAAQSVWVFAYALGLVTTDPTIRAYLEASSWAGMVSLGPLFLGFALEYTGRSDVVQRWPFRALFVFPLGTLLLALTLPSHDLLWQSFRLAPVFELSTVLYSPQPWLYSAIFVGLAAAGVGVLLLVETILTYGPLYRREALAVAFSTVPPTIALSVWVAGLGPYPALNLTVLFMLPHVLLDGYAFVGTHMFETNPTTQRAAEQSALNDLNDPLFVVDTDQQVVNLNARASSLFGLDSATTLPVSVRSLTGKTLERLRDDGEIEVEGADGGVFAVSYTPLTDPRKDVVGGMVVLYDVTDERQREQQLTVLNRVLRHNLRNELTVVKGHAQSIEDETADPELEVQADRIDQSSERLLSIAGKARSYSRLRDRNIQMRDIDAADLVEDICSDLRRDHPDATIDVDITRSTIRSDPELLSATLSNLVENAVVHAEGTPTATVRVQSAADAEDVAVLEVRDRNDPIADTEINPLDEGDETAIEHGSGIGLWIVEWCVSTLNGDVSFRYEDGNVVRATIPLPDQSTASLDDAATDTTAPAEPSLAPGDE